MRTPRHLVTLMVRMQCHVDRVRKAARRDAGYTTETLLVTALLVGLAITAVGIITYKVISRAKGINLG